MKGILEFNLDDSDEKLSHVRAVKADNAYRALYEITMELRKLRKYGEKEEVNIEELEEKIHEIIGECGVSLDEEYK